MLPLALLAGPSRPPPSERFGGTAVDDTIVAIGGAAAGLDSGRHGSPSPTIGRSSTPTEPSPYGMSGVSPLAPAANAAVPDTIVGAGPVRAWERVLVLA